MRVTKNNPKSRRPKIAARAPKNTPLIVFSRQISTQKMQLLSWPLPLNRKIYVFGGSYAFCEGNILSALRAFHTTTIECNFDVQRLFWQSPPINRQRSCSSCVAFDCVNFGPLRYCVKFLAGFVESIPHRCYHFGRRIRRTKFFKCLRARSSSNSDPPSTNLRHLNMRNYCKRDFA